MHEAGGAAWVPDQEGDRSRGGRARMPLRSGSGRRPVANLLSALFSVFVSAVILLLSSAASVAHDHTPAVAQLGQAEGHRVTLSLNISARAFMNGVLHHHGGDAGASGLPLPHGHSGQLSEDLEHILEEEGLPVPEAITVRTGQGVEIPLAPAGQARTILDAAHDDLRVELQLAGELPESSGTVVVGLGQGLGPLILSVAMPEGAPPVFAEVLAPGEESREFAVGSSLKPDSWHVMWEFTTIGLRDVLPNGLAHILFMMAVFLLSPKIADLGWQVVAFTLAHMVSLVMSIYGEVALSGAIGLPLMALSLVFVAGENLVISSITPARIFILFGFALLNSLSFASFIEALDLSPSEQGPALAGFNLGVEIAQIVVLLAMMLLIGSWAGRRRWYRRRFAMPLSGLIAAGGMVWFLGLVMV